MYDKPIKFTKTERKKIAKAGKLPDFKHHERPAHDPHRKLYNLRCAFCGYRSRHRLYVCPTCGACQGCGAQNPTGNPNQHCQVCGNGTNVPEIAVPSVAHSGVHDRPQLVNRVDIETTPHKKRQSSTSVNIGNIQQ